jgi:hypothetical protein
VPSPGLASRRRTRTPRHRARIIIVAHRKTCRPIARKPKSLSYLQRSLVVGLRPKRGPPFFSALAPDEMFG